MLKDLLAESAKQFEVRFGDVELDGIRLFVSSTGNQMQDFISAQISSTFALGEQSGIKKAVEVVEKWAYENGITDKKSFTALVKFLALQSNLTTPEKV